MPHYDNKDHYSLSFILTLPILFPPLCPAAAPIIWSQCNTTRTAYNKNFITA